MDEQLELKPCARCGKDLAAPLTTWGEGLHSVMCMHEDCMAATEHHETRAEAAEAWNAGEVSR
jgi:hypothetical protein